MTNVGSTKTLVISPRIVPERKHLGRSSSRLSTRICQNVDGNNRWDGERRASPVSSLFFASLDPFVSNIEPAALMLINTFFTPAKIHQS
jgi:hypothetical protein